MVSHRLHKLSILRVTNWVWNALAVATAIPCHTSKHVPQLEKCLLFTNFPLVTSWVPDCGYFIWLQVWFSLPCKSYLPQQIPLPPILQSFSWVVISNQSIHQTIHSLVTCIGMIGALLGVFVFPPLSSSCPSTQGHHFVTTYLSWNQMSSKRGYANGNTKDYCSYSLYFH